MQQTDERPNLVFVFPDQFRRQAMGFWQHEPFRSAVRDMGDPVETPNLDRLATQSVVCPRAVSNFPVCSPYRGMMLTGRWPHDNGVTLNCGHDRPFCYLREDVPCISDVLHDAGYSLGYIGKWHADFPHQFDPSRPDWYPGGWDVYTPPPRRHGFDFWYSYGTFDVHKNPHYWDTDGVRHDPELWSPQHEADVAISYIRNDDGQRQADAPFALYVSMNPPHTPNSSLDDVIAEDYARYEDMPLDELLVRPNVDREMPKARLSARYYFAQVTGVDREFGRILQALDDAGLSDNTIVVFTSDHGEIMCSHGLKEAKNRPFAESYEVPLLIRYPQRLKPRIDDILLSTVDLTPTLLGLMGLGDAIPDGVAGGDYSARLAGSDQPGPDSALYLRNVPNQQVIDGMHTGITPVARGIRTAQYTLVLEIDPKTNILAQTFFFDDDADSYQQDNLPLDARPEVTDSLLKRLAGLLRDADDDWFVNEVLADMLPYNAPA